MSQINSSSLNTSTEFASALGETELGVIPQIERALELLGVTLLQTALQETLTIEAQGGVLLPDGRRRTPGGVFFWLLRQRTDPETWSRIRMGERQHPPPALLPPLAWPDRGSVIPEALAMGGEASRALITLQGQPTHIERQADYVIATMVTAESMPSLPKGVPTPPNVTTAFKVCIPQRVWSKLELAWRSPLGPLRVAGYAIPNRKRQHVILFATKALVPKLIQEPSATANAGQVWARLSLAGSIGKVIERGTTMVLALDHKRAPKLPFEFAGLPERTVTYLIYVSAKQWGELASQTLQEVLIDGYTFFDAELNLLSVLTQKTKASSARPRP